MSNNPFMKAFSQPQNHIAGRMQNPMQMLGAWQKFKQSFNGNPQAVVEAMLNDGRMSRQQFDQLASLANQFGQFFR